MDTEDLIDGLLRDRADVARAALSAQQNLARVQAELDEARKAYAAAYRTAAEAGWSDKELTDRLKLTRPANRGGGRPKGSRSRRSTKPDHQQAPETSHLTGDDV